MAKRIEIIQYLRGVASLSVAWFHLTNHWTDGIQVSGSFGWLGVEAFFVISGFVIPYSISTTYETYSPITFANFMSRRLVRIEVPYIASIIIVVVLGYLSAMAPGFHGAAPHYTGPQVAANVFYVARWAHESWLEPVYWTLAFEFAFYITIGILFSALFGKGRSAAYLFAVGILVLATAASYISALVLLFVMGSAVYRYMMGRDRLVIAIGIVVLCATAIGLAGEFVIALTGLATATAIGIGRRIRANGILGQGLTYLGTISYSLYLIHVPIGGRVVNLGGRFVHGPLEHFAVSAAALAVSLAVAHIFYAYIERPAQGIARKLVHFRMSAEATKVPG